MHYFQERDGQWFAEGVPLNTIAKTVGTPCYVYSKAMLEAAWYAFDKSFHQHPHQINYAVKANSNLAVLNILAKCGSGFDIVSQGELERVLKARGDPNKIIFSGVGKTVEELTVALKTGIACINVESKAELLRLNELANALEKKVPIAFRVNPDVDPKSHPYISTGLKENKFGITIKEAKILCDLLTQLPHIQLTGLAFHIGSQITTLSPFAEALDKILNLMEFFKKRDMAFSHLNVGGGLGVHYHTETPPSPEEYVALLLSKIKDPTLTIHIEPGRAIAANAGILLTRVEYLKPQETSDKYFAIVDAGMNDLLRPALYGAWQEILSIANPDPNVPKRMYDIVGPICETADFLGHSRLLALNPGDVLCIRSAGAYGFNMSSNYNSRPRAAEVMVDGEIFEIVRPRESISDLYKNEKII